MNFYTLRQSNIRGHFTGPAVNVVVRARSVESAARKAQRAGVSFSDCCECCGYRWAYPTHGWPTIEEARKWVVPALTPVPGVPNVLYIS